MSDFPYAAAGKMLSAEQGDAQQQGQHADAFVREGQAAVAVQQFFKAQALSHKQFLRPAGNQTAAVK